MGASAAIKARWWRGGSQKAGSTPSARPAHKLSGGHRSAGEPGGEGGKPSRLSSVVDACAGSVHRVYAKGARRGGGNPTDQPAPLLLWPSLRTRLSQKLSSRHQGGSSSRRGGGAGRAADLQRPTRTTVTPPDASHGPAVIWKAAPQWQPTAPTY